MNNLLHLNDYREEQYNPEQKEMSKCYDCLKEDWAENLFCNKEDNIADFKTRCLECFETFIEDNTD